MYQCRFSKCQCTSGVGMLTVGGGHVYMQVGELGEISVLSARFCCEPKTTQSLFLNITLIKLSQDHCFFLFPLMFLQTS